MKLRRLLQLTLNNLRTSRVRTLLAMVGIVVGTALLMFFLGLGQGLRLRRNHTGRVARGVARP